MKVTVLSEFWEFFFSVWSFPLMRVSQVVRHFFFGLIFTDCSLCLSEFSFLRKGICFVLTLSL